MSIINKTAELLNSVCVLYNGDFIGICNQLCQFSNQETNLKLKDKLLLLAKLFDMDLDANNLKNPFTSNTVLSLNFLTSEEIVFLQKLVDCIAQPIIKARITDILGTYFFSSTDRIKYRNIAIKYFNIAIDSYLALKMDSEYSSGEIYNYWHRATSLAISINNKQLISNAKEKLLTELNNNIELIYYNNLKIAVIILATQLDKKVGAEKILPNIVEKLIDEQKKLSLLNSYTYQDYFQIIIKIYNKLSDSDKLIEYTHKLFKELEDKGNFYFSKKNFLLANNVYKSALQIYLTIPKKYRKKLNILTDKINLEKKIKQSNYLRISELSCFEVNIFNLQQQNFNYLKEKNTLIEAILNFSDIYNFEYSSFLQETKNIIFSKMGDFEKISPEDGRTVAIRKAFSNETTYYMQEKIAIAVNYYIIPALNQILQKWIISKKFLIELCKLSSIVPKKREILVAEALYQGFEKNFRTAVHLLTPQLENIIRKILEINGILTTINEEGIENEKGLSALINSKNTKAILGDSLWFELQAVFTNKEGANLRNEVAHGLLDDETSCSESCIYAWWLILKLIVKDDILV